MESENKEPVNPAKEQALARVDAEYYDRESPHYRDNERYSWAVKTINEAFNLGHGKE